MNSTADLLRRAYCDWRSGRAYLDSSGNYRLRKPGTPTHRGEHIGIAPWNKAAKAAYKNAAAFHAAAIAAAEAAQ